MHLDTNLLIAWGAVAKKYRKGDFIFYEGDPSRYYYQILEGTVKMCNFSDEGKIFTQGIFNSGQSFGEPPLFINEVYPACAKAETDCIIYILVKDSLIKILSEYPDIALSFVVGFAGRLYHKSNVSKTIVSPYPEERLLRFLTNYKHENKINSKVIIPYTRQQIADFLGLRVETVIRTTLKMAKDGKLEIKKHKLYF